MKALSLLLTALVLAGCGGRGAADPVTESQAYERVESYVQSAIAAVPGAELEASAPASSTQCKGESPGRVIVANSYWMRGITYDNKYFDTMLRWWTKHGFEVLDDLRPERHYLWVRNPSDSFRMSIRANDKGELLLGAESPCLNAD